MVRGLDYSDGTITLEASDGVFSLQLLEGDAFVRVVDEPSEAILSEEAHDEQSADLLARAMLNVFIGVVVGGGLGTIAWIVKPHFMDLDTSESYTVLFVLYTGGAIAVIMGVAYILHKEISSIL